jgi:hypothetical protein
VGEQGISVDDGDYDKRTAIHLAASEGCLSAVQCLVEELHAAVSPLDRWGRTPLNDATREGHEAVRRYLTQSGATSGVLQPRSTPGGNAEVTKLIRASNLVDLSYSVATDSGGYRRESSRSAPHNLIADTSKLWTLAPSGALPPPAQFMYRAADEAISATALETGGVKISMDGVRVMWEWSSEFARFLRSQDDKAHVDIEDVRVNAANVVVLYVQYGKSGYSPVAKTKGSGEAWVFTAGKLFQGTWARADAAQPFTLKDTAGNIIKLTPGNTWVELPRLAKGVSFLPGTDPTSLKYP